MKIKTALLFLCIFFVLFSFFPSFYEILNKDKLPAERTFVLEHNFMFDYNFYLSRIREGQEGRYMVVEKYYNEPHNGSLFQIVYLYLGKIGQIFSLDPTFVYHISRLIFGLGLLLMIASYSRYLFGGRWVIWAFLLVVTASSFPILMRIGGLPRFGTYMGWWSAIDSLQRITFIPHVLIGQMGIIFLIRRFSERKIVRPWKMIGMGVAGFVIGVIFPPTLIVIYVFLAVLSLFEVVELNKSLAVSVSRDTVRLLFVPFKLAAFRPEDPDSCRSGP